MKKFKIKFYREMLCSTEIDAENEIEAQAIFNDETYHPTQVEIVKESEMNDEFHSVEEILTNQLPLFKH